MRATQMPLELNYRIRIRSSRAKVRRAPDPFDAVLPASDLPSPVACGLALSRRDRERVPEGAPATCLK